MIAEMRRSLLYVPGDSEKMLQRAVAVDADVVMLNLEDGVSASRKDVARDQVARALKSLDFDGREVVVRVNGMLNGAGRRDLAAIVPCRPDGICFPKVEKASDLHAAEAAVLELEVGYGVPEGSIAFHAMIESAAGVLRAAEIAGASARMRSLMFGSADYARDVRCLPGEDRMELLLALQMIVTGARCGGIDAIDAPCFDIRNVDQLRREAMQARRIGFDGKSALHPDQLSAINELFDVTSDEIAWAEKVIAELDNAEHRGRALSLLEGQLIDNPHRAAAERILRRAAARRKA
jgi:citrate lyase subunit beta/citryl-CoA lyase